MILGAIIVQPTPAIDILHGEKVRMEISSPIRTATAHSPIEIEGNENFTATVSENGWSGAGTPGNPYIIENLEITLTQESEWDTAISIIDTDQYFKIRKCVLTSELFNNGEGPDLYGIHLENVTNGMIEYNYIYGGYIGIFLGYQDCYHIFIRRNIFYENFIGLNLKGDNNFVQLNDFIWSRYTHTDYPYFWSPGVNLIETNFWSMHITPDYNKDGIVDIPYQDDNFPKTTPNNYHPIYDGNPYLIPKPFDLSSDADTPDLDGNFILSWTEAVGADNYTVYLNENVYATGLDVQNRLFIGLSSGTYVFSVTAFNRFGEITSSTHTITVDSENPESDSTTNNNISGYILGSFLFVGGLTSYLLVKKYRYRKSPSN
jgi:hypothetical protein